MGQLSLSQLLSCIAVLCALGTAGCGRLGLDILPQSASDGGSSDDATLGMDSSILPTRCASPACLTPGCPNDDSKTNPGICGCGTSDTADADGDKIPDCIDFCPGIPDGAGENACGCAAARADSDGDGALNCLDRCPFDFAKQTVGQCGCGTSEHDGDGDGTPDCVDECPDDANKSRAGMCGCGVREQDTDLDGMPDCADRCPGTDVPYTPDNGCGLGYCRANNVASTCTSGVETSCMPAAPLAQTDDNCDGVDDDCDGRIDEDYGATVSACGVGACARMGMKTCVNGEVVNSCVAGPATGADNDCNNVDDDCNGTADDGYNGGTTACGTGACSITGVLSCVNGAIVNSCTPPTVGATRDTTCNNIDDDCDGMVDEDYVATSTSCGVGACGRTGTRTCVRGREVNSCVAGSPTATRDTTCNNVDEDCDGRVDDDYATSSTSCGVGYCASTGQRTCVAGATRDSCVAKAPRSSTDDAFAPGNGVDDDCDGSVDEDVPACNTSLRTFEAGQYTVAVPGNCHSLTVRLWGAGGASGKTEGFGNNGDGGPGGYATATVLVTGAINLYVGNGGASNCGNGGVNPGSAAYNGGEGGPGNGSNGGDGSVAGGGTGGNPIYASSGGRGYFGGGGGGQGYSGFAGYGEGGGGGAASVLIVNGMRAAVAGGGGGGGGAQAFAAFGLASPGGTGGAGCGGDGDDRGSAGGGGGGGGVCQGTTVTRGSGRNPANASAIPNGRATGGGGSCSAGGNGYATIQFAP